MRRITSRDIARLRRIERQAYPPAYRQMQDIYTYDDLCDYCEGRPHVLHLSSGYLLWTKREIVDLAMVGKPTLGDVVSVLRVLRRHLSVHTLTLDARHNTSWPLVKTLADRGWIEIRSDNNYSWAGERFHELEIKLRR